MRYLHFCLDFSIWQKNGLIRKLRLVSENMTSQTEQQMNTRHILPNISRGKGNKEMKFGQLIEYNVRNTFIQKLCRQCGRKTNSFFFFFNCYLAVPRPTLGHSQGDSLTNPMLITAYVHIWPEGHRESRNRVGP